MNDHVDMIVELWSQLKPLIPSKDRHDAAYNLVAVFDDYGMADGLDASVNTLDTALKAAVKSHFAIDEEYDEDDDYED